MASTALASVPEAAKSFFAAASRRRNGNTATGVVVSAGLAQKTAKVRVGGDIWNQKVQKVLSRGLPPPPPQLSFAACSANHSQLSANPHVCTS